MNNGTELHYVDLDSVVREVIPEFDTIFNFADKWRDLYVKITPKKLSTRIKADITNSYAIGPGGFGTVASTDPLRISYYSYPSSVPGYMSDEYLSLIPNKKLAILIKEMIAFFNNSTDKINKINGTIIKINQPIPVKIAKFETKTVTAVYGYSDMGQNISHSTYIADSRDSKIHEINLSVDSIKSYIIFKDDIGRALGHIKLRAADVSTNTSHIKFSPQNRNISSMDAYDIQRNVGIINFSEYTLFDFVPLIKNPMFAKCLQPFSSCIKDINDTFSYLKTKYAHLYLINNNEW